MCKDEWAEMLEDISGDYESFGPAGRESPGTDSPHRKNGEGSKSIGNTGIEVGESASNNTTSDEKISKNSRVGSSAETLIINVGSAKVSGTLPGGGNKKA